ncbi:ABC transporter substrate-binding protein [Acidisphaera sp. S103]|uniref:ABC transporter substrate-binding protein n=1 Tax=Acidisphaera sp. S103 TaxID=1747223 RepID=UPI00131D50DB|nr:ABC transporter substrate-binding protein [Acidisphaera sp. S103]
MLKRILGSVLLAGLLLASAAQANEPLRLGLLHTLSPAPFYIAQERGYFKDEGIDLTFRFFQAAQPIAAAAVAGDIDVGVTALTGGFFNLAEKGTLKVIGGAMHEEKGYEGSAILVSNKAFDAGLTSIDKLPGHSLAITQYGSSFHYIMGRIAEEHGFDLKSITLRPVQQIANMVAAVTSDQVDATIAIASVAKPLAASGQVHILGWVGDVVPYQLTAVFTTPAMIANKPDLLKHFAAAYQRGVADYRDAFLRLDAAGHPVVDAKTDAAVALLTKYVFTGDPDARRKILSGVGFYDAGGALDVKDVENQVRWFKAQGLVKGDMDPAVMLDTHFLPTR